MSGENNLAARLEAAVMSDGKLDGGEFEALEREFAPALNLSPCPCGSGKKFNECCKANWQLLQRTRNRAREEQRATRKEQAGEGRGLEWLLRIGVDPRGGLVIDDAGSGKRLPMIGVVELLFKAWMDAFLRLSSMEAMRAAQQATRPESKPGPGKIVL